MYEKFILVRIVLLSILSPLPYLSVYHNLLNLHTVAVGQAKHIYSCRYVGLRYPALLANYMLGGKNTIVMENFFDKNGFLSAKKEREAHLGLSYRVVFCDFYS